MIQGSIRMVASVFAVVIMMWGLPSAEALAASHQSSLTGDGVQALYQGHMVSYAKLRHALGTTYCDDFRGYGKLTCYGSERSMDGALLAEGGYSEMPAQAARVAHELGVPVPPTSGPAIPAAGSACHPYVVLRL